MGGGSMAPPMFEIHHILWWHQPRVELQQVHKMGWAQLWWAGPIARTPGMSRLIGISKIKKEKCAFWSSYEKWKSSTANYWQNKALFVLLERILEACASASTLII